MNKSIKIVIGILIIIIISVLGIFLAKDYIFKETTKESESKTDESINESNTNTTYERMIMVNGKLYYDTQKESTVEARCGNMDGKIASNVAYNEIPTEDNQSNFEGDYGYQYGAEDTIEVKIDNKWQVFKAKDENNNEDCSFYGVVKESDSNHILVQPNEGEKERKSSNLISVSLENNNDMIYPLESNVKITYNGIILETYPAQIKAIKIELKSADDFTIKVYNKVQETSEKIHTIIDKTETNKYDYNVYSYDANVNIVINGEEISLRQALLQNKITMDEIIKKANKDIKNPIMYKDGGSMEYHYDLYTIIKMHNLDGNRDMYIGVPELTLNEVEKVN